jgi:outer membrane protein TolC
MKTTKHLAVAALFLAVAVAAATAEAPVVKLQAAVDAALASGEDLRIAKGSLDAARAQRDLALSRAGISLSGSGSYSLADAFGADLKAIDPVRKTATATASSLSGLVGREGATQRIDGSLALSAGNASASNPYSKLSLSVAQSIPPSPATPTTSLGASWAQTIWDGYPGGQTRASIQKAALAYQMADLTARQSRSAVVAAAKKAYVAMLAAQRSLALNTAVSERQSSLLKQVEATYALRQASTIELSSARIAARKAELDLETSRHDLALARQRLANLMGSPADADFSVAEIEEPILPAATEAEAIAIGLAKRADAAQIGLRKKSAEIDLVLAKAGSQPALSGTAGFTLGLVGGKDPGTANSASLALRLSLPVLDSGAAQAQAANVAAQIAGYDAQAAQLADRIAADIREYYWSASILSERIGLAKMAQDLADSKLVLAKTQFQYGTSTVQDLIAAQNDAAKAASDYLAAKADYLVKELDLETAMGL